MSNEIFTSLVDALSPIFGTPSQLPSGNGCRYRSSGTGTVTVYSKVIASGNLAEIAFNPDSIATLLHMQMPEFDSFVEELQGSTGRPVKPNKQHKWPRIGFSSQAHVALVIEALHERLNCLAN